ncbi:MAG TPA: ATP phosphoribosyltransferase [Acidobacteriota bacterium]|nr:ATP phosphoribosyltransferase [Acidobacteriota bacterium]HNB71041.1 ATP phosphoribosyltransferase [Acidobacteriota bacterium]HND19971.1 ATP phosphoribosyltransferase [Acidobacteriota bacterium]HNG91558.1 ATP phosphoribosyltransferase [Acidobacteriota bacterium]HNH81075.1 ATP phosphoribosyltransferase [Acidobacteriota bacterium]
MPLKLVVPKGRIYNEVAQLLAECGITLQGDERNYRPIASDPNLAVKLLKSQNIPPLVALGQHDIGFAGYDWVVEQNAEVEQLLDLGFDPVRIVACIPEQWSVDELRSRPIIAVSEYENITRDYLTSQGFDFTFVRSYGSTEVFPPEDADLIVDNTSTGSTLQANRLKIIGTLLTSTTRLIANRRALDNPENRQQIEDLMLLIRGVLNGRSRVLLEMNCPPDRLELIVTLLPAMRSPTVAKLYQDSGFSVKAAVKKNQVKELIPKLIAAGATDILETPIRKVI